MFLCFPNKARSTCETISNLAVSFSDAAIKTDERSPSTKATLGSNSTHLTVRFDERTGWVMAIAALDNLTKGASGQAVQCANIATGLPEGLGLDAAGLYP